MPAMFAVGGRSISRSASWPEGPLSSDSTPQDSRVVVEGGWLPGPSRGFFGEGVEAVQCDLTVLVLDGSSA